MVGALLFLGLSAVAFASDPAASSCGQANVEAAPPVTANSIEPRSAVEPFYQWNANDGYCGETSLMQAGMNNGQWMSQFNARLVCGSGLGQTGDDSFCAAHDQNSNFNSQLLLESPLPGDQPFADAPDCLANARLSAHVFDSAAQPAGMAGFEQYMSWVKAEMIAGRQVTIGVTFPQGEDPQYDHEVTVVRIGTNHDPRDPSYYDDDVLYLEDHGGIAVQAGKPSDEHDNIPIGAGGDPASCNPYVFGYTFAELAQTRDSANAATAPQYSILIPGGTVATYTGGDGVNLNPRKVMGKNYGFSVGGPADDDKVTLPVTLRIASASVNGQANKPDTLAGYNYENPVIGGDENGCSNAPPASWMSLTLVATVSGLEMGRAYQLYEYQLDTLPVASGASAALAVPTSGFNAKAKQATAVTSFTATAATFSHTVTVTSDKIVVFRCVPADAP